MWVDERLLSVGIQDARLSSVRIGIRLRELTGPFYFRYNMQYVKDQTQPPWTLEAGGTVVLLHQLFCYAPFHAPNPARGRINFENDCHAYISEINGQIWASIFPDKKTPKYMERVFEKLRREAE